MKLFIFILLCSASAWIDKKVLDSPLISSRIIGGNIASPGQFPWTVAIYINTPNGRTFCGGTILEEQWILTAAQCIIDATSVIVLAGSTKLQGVDPNRVIIPAATFFSHPEFNSSILSSDIGLIKLDKPLTFNDYIKPPLVLNGRSQIDNGVEVEAAGWGTTSDSTVTLTNDLNFVKTTILGSAECKAVLGEYLVDGMCCTGGNTNLGFCFGDTGGALMGPAPMGNGTVLVGLASFLSAKGCESNEPKGYTRIDDFYEWIVDTILNDTSD